MTLKPNTTPGRSEMSYGAGLAKHPQSNFQQTRDLVFPEGDDSRDLMTEYRASLRLDATRSDENVMPDMLFVEGNPDAFGPGLPLVREQPNRPRGAHPQPQLRYGVDRQS